MVFRPGATVDERPRQLVRRRVEFAVGQRPGAVGDRDAVWRGLRGRRQQPGEVFDRTAAFADCRDEIETLVQVEHRQVADRGARVRGRRLQHADQARTESGHRVPVEESGGVTDLEGEAGGLAGRPAHLGERELQIEGGATGVHAGCGRREPGEVEPDGGTVLQGHRHLEVRVDIARTGRVQFGHQPVERHVGVVERVQIGFPDTCHQVGERQVLVDDGAQRQRVDEHAHEIVEVGVAASGHRCADDDVRGLREGTEQDRHRGVEHHEDRGVGLGSDGPDRAVGVGADGRGHRRSGPAGHL